MSKTIVNKAQIQCDLGAVPQTLNVTSQDFVKISGSLVATEADKVPVLNIPSFGTCRRIWYHPTCKPSPTEWTRLSKQNSILGQKQLRISSTCKCQHGGEISFIDAGENKHASSK